MPHLGSWTISLLHVDGITQNLNPWRWRLSGKNSRLIYVTLPNFLIIYCRANLHFHLALEHISYDCCDDSCICYADHDNETHCAKCELPRHIYGKARKTFDYISLIHRLRAIWANCELATKMKQYRAKMEELIKQNNNRGTRSEKRLTDFWTGDLCSDMRRNKGVWNNNREMAFILTTDGVQLFKLGKFAVSWSPPPPHYPISRC